MSLMGKPLDTIAQEDLQALVDNKVREFKHIEYKQSLPSNKESDRKEFLGDVSSFANAAGGDLIYAMQAKDGVATKVSGLPGINVDQEILRLESMIRDGIRPRIHAVSTQPIKLDRAGVVLIIRVPRSWYPPHMVVLSRHDRFYTRSSNGKHPMDVSELRVAFTLSETTAERIRAFREGRLARIVAGETPVVLYDAPKIVLHIVPFGAFDPAARFDVASLAQKTKDLAPIGSSSWNDRHNFDGFLTYDWFDQQVPISYVQVFRNGTVEAVDSYLLRSRADARPIEVQLFETSLVDALRRYLSIQKDLGVEPPLFVMLSLLGVSGYVLHSVPAGYRMGDEHPIDRDDLLVPGIMVDSFDSAASQVMKPGFDAVWNATGYPRAMSYDDEGKWKLETENR